MRFFIDDWGVDPGHGVIRASELRMNNNVTGLNYEDDDLIQHIYNSEPPVVHGHKFENMFNADREIDMTNQEISAYHFSKDGDFAGLTIRDTHGEEIVYMTEELDFVETMYQLDSFLNIWNTTRLVGFRTSLRCRTSQVIKQIQPIYYSIDKDVCQNLLGQIPRGMLEETPSFGKECNESKLGEAIYVSHQTAQFQSETQQFEAVTLLFVILITFGLALLCAIFFSQRRQKNLEIRKKQNITA